MSDWNHIQRLSVEVLRPLLWAFVVGALCGGAVVALLLLAGCAPKHQHERVAYHARLTSDRVWAVDVEADDGCVLLTFYLPSPYRTPSVVMQGRGWGENIWNSADGDTFYSDTLHADTTRYRRVVP